MDELALPSHRLWLKQSSSSSACLLLAAAAVVVVFVRPTNYSRIDLNRSRKVINMRCIYSVVVWKSKNRRKKKHLNFCCCWCRFCILSNSVISHLLYSSYFAHYSNEYYACWNTYRFDMHSFFTLTTTLSFRDRESERTL